MGKAIPSAKISKKVLKRIVFKDWSIRPTIVKFSRTTIEQSLERAWETRRKEQIRQSSRSRGSFSNNFWNNFPWLSLTVSGAEIKKPISQASAQVDANVLTTIFGMSAKSLDSALIRRERIDP